MEQLICMIGFNVLCTGEYKYLIILAGKIFLNNLGYNYLVAAIRI